MRIYLPADLHALERLRDGQSISLQPVIPASDDELHEFDALTAAGAQGGVVIAADVDAADTPVELDRVASFHLDADGSGDMSWYAPQELGAVIDLLSR